MTHEKQHVLFVCTLNLQRSPTAQDMVERDLGQRFEVKSAGIDPLAETQVTQHHVDWADIIIVMETMHRAWLHENLEIGDTLIHVLDISDRYRRDDPELRALLTEKLEPILMFDADDN